MNCRAQLAISIGHHLPSQASNLLSSQTCSHRQQKNGLVTHWLACLLDQASDGFDLRFGQRLSFLGQAYEHTHCEIVRMQYFIIRRVNSEALSVKFI